MNTKEDMYECGLLLLQMFCSKNISVYVPEIESINKDNRFYHLNTCGYYRHFKLVEENNELVRKNIPTITIMVPKCAHKGTSGRQWSWPGYVIDRTPFG